jgi:hypothetical protein
VQCMYVSCKTEPVSMVLAGVCVLFLFVVVFVVVVCTVPCGLLSILSSPRAHTHTQAHTHPPCRPAWQAWTERERARPLGWMDDGPRSCRAGHEKQASSFRWGEVERPEKKGTDWRLSAQGSRTTTDASKKDTECGWLSGQKEMADGN